MDNIIDKTRKEMYDYILETPISYDTMVAGIYDILESLDGLKISLSNTSFCSDINFRKYCNIFYIWFPFAIKRNHYTMDEIVDILNIIAENETFKRGCERHPIIYTESILITLVNDITSKVQFTTTELSKLIDLVCGKTNDPDDLDRFGLILGMRSQALDEQFLYNNYIKTYQYSSNCKKLLSLILPILPDQERFITKYIDDIDTLYIFEKTMLSDDFIINYFENNKDYIHDFIDDHMDVAYDVAAYRKFSPRLIKYFTDNKYDTILKFYNSSFISKSTEDKKSRVLKCNRFKCYKNYFYGYKAVDMDNYSYSTFRFRYEPGKTYETAACGDGEDGSGFYVSTIDIAKETGEINSENILYRPYKIIKVKVYYDDIAWVSGTTVRCSKFTVCD